MYLFGQNLGADHLTTAQTWRGQEEWLYPIRFCFPWIGKVPAAKPRVWNPFLASFHLSGKYGLLHMTQTSPPSGVSSLRERKRSSFYT